MDPFTHYAMVVVEEAMKDAGIDTSKIDPPKV